MRFVCCFLAAIGCLAIPALGAEDWPQWRGANRDGKSEEPGLKLDWKSKPPQHLWTISGMGNGYASVSIANNRLYTTGNFPDGQAVVCIDLASQKPVWRTPVTSGPPQHDYAGSRSTPTIDGDRLYIVSSDGRICCLNTADGKVIWTRDFRQDFGGKLMSGWGFSESPLVDGDRVVCTPGGDAAAMVALDKLTGKEIWRTAVPYQGDRGKDGAGYSSIVISEGAKTKQYVQMVGHGLIGVRAEDGKLLWGYDKVANDIANIPTPLVKGDFIFASTGYQTGACLLRLTKTKEGVNAKEVYFLDPKTFQNHHGGMILDGDFIYAGHQHNKGIPICVHLPTGKVRWGGKARPPGEGSAGVTEVNDQLIFRYQDGTVALINANEKTYELLGTFKPEYQERESWAHPVVAGGKLYLREQDKLMCYQL
ncbi:PQQ-binding-like beta-propeller repeat protein [Planctomicrobium piriforme]|uniref:Outer membrane protein assembly factor BamB, contains PQQ-like beta-propeller repeat n=1 Tax=Planctomicrobium piriforme TaxID=1576369 RepID=A0A1I3JBE1_9PLAN|nr:PQQ-binding-like beta-propeller repeat protein [Planctomicrobium piriforme]SFI57543.1 Outer membrane protein assembly factor BamB, contains PQQ-like beta-propeller repeat [Planctomicrobium piriforme]